MKRDDLFRQLRLFTAIQMWAEMIKQNPHRQRKRVQQGKGGRMPGLLDLRNLRALGDGAAVQHREPVAQLQYRYKIMGDVEQCRSVSPV